MSNQMANLALFKTHFLSKSPICSPFNALSLGIPSRETAGPLRRGPASLGSGPLAACSQNTQFDPRVAMWQDRRDDIVLIRAVGRSDRSPTIENSHRDRSTAILRGGTHALDIHRAFRSSVGRYRTQLDCPAVADA